MNRCYATGRVTRPPTSKVSGMGKLVVVVHVAVEQDSAHGTPPLFEVVTTHEQAELARGLKQGSEVLVEGYFRRKGPVVVIHARELKVLRP
jgi:single-stranded DNA-binding protein